MVDEPNAKLGLRRRTVRLDEHRQEWLSEANRVSAEIAAAASIPREHVSHVGSTAVPSLVAKPILDFVVRAAPGREIDRIAAAIESIGYIDRGQGEGSIGRLLVLEPTPDVRSVHVHILDETRSWWDDYHAFRDALRSDPQLRDRYAELKERLAAEHPLDRSAYVAGKAQFVATELERLRD